MSVINTKSFFRWRGFRAWFPVFLFVAYWANSYLNYHLGFLIREPLRVQTHIYLWVSLFVFIAGYSVGLGKPKRMLVIDAAQVYALNRKWLLYTRWVIVMVFFGALGLIADRIISGAGSIEKTLMDTEIVREEFMGGTSIVTTLSMGLYVFSFVGFSLYFLATAIGYKIQRLYHLLIYGTFALLCFNAFLSTNRGSFFAVATYVIFMIFYVQGATIKELLISRRYFILRIAGVAFVALSLFYFFWISRNRSSEDWLESIETHNFTNRDRYGLYKMDFEANDISAFLLTYSYVCEGYQYIDLFLTKAEPFHFAPAMLFGSRSVRQFKRFMPKRIRDRKFTAVQRGNNWRDGAGLSLYGWPTIWGWNLAMFGYIGAVLFMFLYGWWLGYCSGQFLRFANVGALMICFANYSVLMTSYNALGGDVQHQFAIFLGTYILLSRSKKVRCMHRAKVPYA